jgi:hypothetical protein
MIKKSEIKFFWQAEINLNVFIGDKKIKLYSDEKN